MSKYLYWKVFSITYIYSGLIQPSTNLFLALTFFFHFFISTSAIIPNFLILPDLPSSFSISCVTPPPLFPFIAWLFLIMKWLKRVFAKTERVYKLMSNRDRDCY